MKTPLNIAIRADASIEIGSGHVMRCLTLADALVADGNKCHFLCRDLPGHIMAVIAERGHDFTALTAPETYQPDSVHVTPADPPHASWLGVPLEEEIKQSLEALENLAPDRVVVDHYALDARWETRAIPSGTPVTVIDDLADRTHICDSLLDQNLGRNATDYDGLVPPYCKRLIGPHFALLRPEFAELRDSALARRRNARLGNLLITLGGIDKDNVSGAVLDAISHINLPANLKITVVMGKGAPWLDAVSARAEVMPCPTRVLSAVSNMAELMANADLCIGAAGGTSWERCAMGLPTILLVLADNQRPGATALAKNGAAVLLNGVHKSSPEASALEAAFNFFQKPTNFVAMVEASASICDGRGCDRSIRQVQKLDIGK